MPHPYIPLKMQHQWYNIARTNTCGILCILSHGYRFLLLYPTGYLTNAFDWTNSWLTALDKQGSPGFRDLLSELDQNNADASPARSLNNANMACQSTHWSIHAPSTYICPSNLPSCPISVTIQRNPGLNSPVSKGVAQHHHCSLCSKNSLARDVINGIWP